MPHDEVLKHGGQKFSERVGGSGRRVVLASSHGPNSTVFARSISRKTNFSHPKHVHDGEIGTCALDEDGWIAYKVPVSVPASALCEDTYSCREPNEGWLMSELKRFGAL